MAWSRLGSNGLVSGGRVVFVLVNISATALADSPPLSGTYALDEEASDDLPKAVT